MKAIYSSRYRLPVFILMGLSVGCGEASSDVPEFQGGASDSSDPQADEPANEQAEEEEMAEPPAEPESSEGQDATLPLQPSEEDELTDMSAEEGEPEEIEDMEPEEPVELGPLPKFVGNITTGNSVDTNGLVFSDYWDQITPENAGKWGSVQQNADSPFNWNTLDAIYDYTEQSGIIFKEHVFVWGSQQPGGNITAEHVRTWMSEFCSRYPNTRLIEVVNEPPPHTEPSYAEAMGGGTNGDWRWIVNAFTWAREFCPNAILMLNDYNNIEFGNQTDHFIDIVQAIQAQGAPIDAVGAQAHGLSNASDTTNMITLLNRLHDETGLPVHITEYDINVNDDATQLQRVQDHVSFFLETEWIEGITLWGWIFGRTWVPSSGLIRNGEPRPSMVWLMEELGRPVPQ